MILCWFCHTEIAAGGFIAFGDDPMHRECAVRLDQTLKDLDLIPPLPPLRDESD